ncbi:MAG: coiled-coil domain-containing protein [Flavobacteriales bacterium]
MADIFPNSQQKLKSYWNRPGGKFGIFMGLGILAVIGYFVFPILETVVWNTLNFGIALACLAVFLYMITHRKLRLSLYYFYEILMKKLVGIVIELDPFIIAEDYLSDMEEQREKLYKQSTDVDAQKEKINLKIKEKRDEISKLMTKAQVAKDKNMMPELGNATRQIGRLNEYVSQLTPIHDNLSRIGDYLTKIHKNSAYLIEDARNELELKKDLYKSVTSGNKALNSALKIFKGDPEKKLLVEQSMEFLKEDIAGKLANMKKAISYSADFMQSIDLDNATYEKEGLKLLESVNPDSGYKLNSSVTQNVNGPVSSHNDLLK